MKNFSKISIIEQKKFFKEIESWAKNELNDIACEMFITALYNAKNTQKVIMLISFENAIAKMKI